MKITCPSCGADYPIEAGLLEDDGKRLAAICGEMEPPLARAALAYLRLFKPVKTSLRTTRAIKLLQELLALVRVGTVCRDERNGLHRPAPIAAWVAGIEQMLQQPGRLTLPLTNHNYLRHVVFGFADQADAQAERDREKRLRVQPSIERQFLPRPEAKLAPMDEHLQWLKDKLSRQFITQEEHDRQAAEARARYGAQQ